MGAVCPNWARTDLCGGREVTRVPTAKLLAQWHLDESAIEAEAIRNQAAQLAGFDQMLSLAKSRRDKALRRIADCQDRRFAKQLRDASDRVIEGKTVVQIENRSAKRTA